MYTIYFKVDEIQCIVCNLNMNLQEIENTKAQNLYYQTNPQLFDELVRIVFGNLKAYAKILKPKQYLINWLNSQLKFLNSQQYQVCDYKLNQRIYMLFAAMTDFPKCQTRGKPLIDTNKFRNITDGFLLCCSQQCSVLHKVQSYKKTCLKQYGIESHMKNPQVFKKYKENLQAKFGVENVFQRDDVKAKIRESKQNMTKEQKQAMREKQKATRFEHFGAWESQEIKESRKQAFIRRYGVDNNMKSEIGRNEYDKAIQQKFGVKNVSQLNKIKNKKIETCRLHYGVDYPQQSSEVVKKTRYTCLKKYGYEHPTQNPIVKRKCRLKYEYQGVMFDSKPELAFYIWLKDHDIDFDFHPNITFIYKCFGKLHIYQPDFKVNNQLIEIKGDHFFKSDGTMRNPYNHQYDELVEAKHQCMLANNVKIIRTADYKKYLEYVLQKYGVKLFKDARCQLSSK